MTGHSAAPRSPVQARVSRAPSRRPTRCSGHLQRPLAGRFHKHDIAEPVLQRGTRWAVLLDGLDNIRHLPEEWLDWLERHRLAIVHWLNIEELSYSAT
jgi:hypothetical protein